MDFKGERADKNSNFKLMRNLNLRNDLTFTGACEILSCHTQFRFSLHLKQKQITKYFLNWLELLRLKTLKQFRSYLKKFKDLWKLKIFEGLYTLLHRFLKDFCCFCIVMNKPKIFKYLFKILIKIWKIY